MRCQKSGSGSTAKISAIHLLLHNALKYTLRGQKASKGREKMKHTLKNGALRLIQFLGDAKTKDGEKA